MKHGAIYVPDGTAEAAALRRTTDLCITAHQDAGELWAYGPIAACYAKLDRWFSAVTVTDGAGSPRTGDYGSYTDEQMKAVREQEQNSAALLGGYGFMAQLKYSSAEVKKTACGDVTADIRELLLAARPETVYTHNLADKHDTHVAVALRTIAALRSLPIDARPKKVYGLEGWRDLDWMCDGDKVCFDTAPRPHLSAALLGVFDSQIAGGKRYDSAAMGRRLANATFFASHATDAYTSVSYGMDLTELAFSDEDPAAFIAAQIERFKKDATDRLEALK
ncbi:MAG: PIG-L family deacetylase [Oscillospiraceae bacterium]|nr:PIG-L family deacetylase [Oscillospiraceae bacterium]